MRALDKVALCIYRLVCELVWELNNYLRMRNYVLILKN